MTARGLKAEVFTDLCEAAARAACLHSRRGLRALVGVGGDGTAAELVNRTMPGLPITMFPSGNENLLAKYLGLGETPESLCQTVAEGTLLRLDAGKANGRLFLLMLSCGFDAEVVRRVHDRRQGHIRSRDYLKPILQSIRTYQYPAIRVCWDTDGACAAESLLPSIEARWLFVFNLPCYGGGLRLAPWADGLDGLLDVCTFRRGALWHGLRYVSAVLLGRHQRLADCTTRRVRRLQATSQSSVPYQLDGDPAGCLPVDVEVLPGRLTVVVPRSRAEELAAGRR